MGRCPQQQLKTQDKHPFLISHQKGVELFTIFKNLKTRIDGAGSPEGGAGHFSTSGEAERLIGNVRWQQPAGANRR